MPYFTSFSIRTLDEFYGYLHVTVADLWHLYSGNTTKASEGSTPAVLNMPAEYNGSSEMGVGQPMVSYSFNFLFLKRVKLTTFGLFSIQKTLLKVHFMELIFNISS